MGRFGVDIRLDVDSISNDSLMNVVELLMDLSATMGSTDASYNQNIIGPCTLND